MRVVLTSLRILTCVDRERVGEMFPFGQLLRECAREFDLVLGVEVPR